MDDESWNIQVVIGDNTRNFCVPPNSRLDVLFEKIAKRLSDDYEPENCMVLFGGQRIMHSSEKRLSDYSIVNGSRLILLLRGHGGIFPLNALKDKKYNLKPLPGYVTVTSSEEDVDMISLDNDTTELRAKMPCGHVIGPSSMTSYCHSLLSKGLYQFKCPLCDVEWPYFVVRHVACLSDDEMRQFEEKISRNYTDKTSEIQGCPGCHIFCFRENKSDKRIRCALCTKQKKKPFDFCWKCIREWKMPSSTTNCGNADCDSLAVKLQTLANCPIKKIGDAEVPSYRGCPQCGVLIEHIDKCKHMTCKACKCSFCFACLKQKQSGKNWECTPYKNECKVAPPQKSLP